MATTAPMLLPWRAIVQSVTTRTSTRAAPQCPRAVCPAIQQPLAKRWASGSASNTPVNTGDAATGPGMEGKSASSSRASAAKPDNASTVTTTPPSTSSSLSEQESPQTGRPKGGLNPSTIRPPRAVQAAYLRPLRRLPTHGLPVCDLQLRSYSVRNLEFFADFCLRAAYYLGLPASGPVPLPRITERWTVPKGSFIHKKSQENFERKTLRRLIQIKDGEVETVEVWLAFIQKYAYYGIGMKANVWSFEKLGVGKNMDAGMEQMRAQVEPTLRQFAFKKGSAVEDKVLELINREDFKAASGGNAPMIRVPTWKLPKNEVVK